MGLNSNELISIPANDENTGEHYRFYYDRIDNPRNMNQSLLSQFLSNFTLGFADGLTVPFALTAGLSSLGDTRTVIYAGMAEICAGCISMGVGGFLAAKGQTDAKPERQSSSRKLEAAETDSVQSYLDPLDLPPDLLQAVRSHIYCDDTVFRRLVMEKYPTLDGSTDESSLFPPVFAGLSVSFGYLLGGLLPLFPYFFVSKVGDGLVWSFPICLLALFAFGVVKYYLLHYWLAGNAGDETGMSMKVSRCCLEGVGMVLMGGFAACAAVLCVAFFASIMS
ncbi:Ccc1 family [Hypoxylon rubiginosum]|uniref:Ccc1 family n=1 Tax=Hypoxylon rubiginosum TaxID=110542 RepID=A0ACC0DER4_9PEZI|nr:Ccc1 family [Hypoxylon rubiginosum]